MALLSVPSSGVSGCLGLTTSLPVALKHFEPGVGLSTSRKQQGPAKRLRVPLCHSPRKHAPAIPLPRAPRQTYHHHSIGICLKGEYVFY